MAQLVERGFEVFAGGFGGFFDDCGGGKIGENNRPLLDSIFRKFREYAFKSFSSRTALSGNHQGVAFKSVEARLGEPVEPVGRRSVVSGGEGLLCVMDQAQCTMGVAESRLHFGFNRIQPSKEMSRRVGAPGECSGSSDLVACILGACDFAGERRSKSHMCQRC